MDCSCYPWDKRGAYNHGCRGQFECWVTRDIRERLTPEGLAKQQADYHAECRARAGEDNKPDPREIKQKLVRLGVSERALSDLSSETKTISLTAARQWWHHSKEKSSMLLLLGAPGVGKTVAAAWCAYNWAYRFPWNSRPSGGNLDQPFAWLDAGQLRAVATFGEGKDAMIKKLRHATFLILDDAGRDSEKQAIEFVADVLSERMDRKRLTILTANLTAAAFVTRYGSAVADRCKSSALIPTLTGTSLRCAK